MVQMVMHEDRCKGCGLCEMACPKNLVSMSSRINVMGFQPATVENPELCTGCAMCARMCPDLVFEIRKMA